MISVVRAGFCPELSPGSRIIDALNNEFSEAPAISNVRKLIVIKRIDPEEFEDQEVNAMSVKDDDFEFSQEDLDALEDEIPPEVDEMSMEDLGLTDDDLDDIDLDDDGFDDELTDEDLEALEKEIPPEVDQLEDGDLDDEGEGEESPKRNKEDSDELDDYI